MVSSTIEMTSNNVINNNHNGGGQIEMPTEALRQASQLIFDMDDWIKSELNMLEKFYLTDYQDVPFERAINKAKRKFEKRRGPTLIKPLNKRKNKMVVGNMEYDPITQIWKGNDNELSGFPNTPALITNLGKTEERVVGNMKWDPNQKEWRGNESDLSKFRFLKPALITQLNSNLNPRVENGMVYDPVTMKWRGNEDVLDVFETMDDQNNDNTFTVGKEFNLTASLLQEFSSSQFQHNKALNGWFPTDRDLTDRDFLYSIRSMSIMQLVKSAHHTNAPSGGTSINGTASTMQTMAGPGIIPLNLNKKKPIVDETNDWDDVDFEADKPALKLNLKVHLDQDDEMGGMSDSENWDKEMGFTSEDDTLSSTNNDNTISSSASQPQTPRKVEEWSDFGDTSGSLSGKITQLNKFREAVSNINSTTGKGSSEEDDDLDWSGLEKNMKKGGSLKFPQSANIRNIHSIEKSFKRGGTLNNIPPIPSTSVGSLGGSTNNTPLSSSSSTIPNINTNTNNPTSSAVEENYDDTFTVPKGAPLKIVQKPHSDNFDQFDEPCEETIRFFENDKDVVEEDWPEVQFPMDLGHKNSVESRKSPPIRNQVVEDYSDELDIPSIHEPLKLKKHLLIANPFGDDQDDETWDDVPFPVDFRPATPIQSLTTSTSKLTKPTTITNTSNNNNTTTTNTTTSKPTTTTTTTTTTTSTLSNKATSTSATTFSTPVKDNKTSSSSSTATQSTAVKSTPKINNIRPGDILSTPMSVSKLNTSTSAYTAHLSPFTPTFPKPLNEILKSPDNDDDDFMFDDDDDDDFFHSTPFKSR